MTEMTETTPSTDSTMDLNLQNVLMHSLFAFAVLKGKDSIVTLANDSIKRMWGKGNDVEGKSLFEVLPEIKTQGFPELIDAVYRTGVPYIGEEKLVKLLRGGKLEDVYFNFTYEPYREIDGAISGVSIIAYEVTGVPYQYVAIRTDITAQKRISEELLEAKVYAELATKIAEEAKTKAEEATLIAENAVKAKQQFLSNMSHEIRTPMNAIIGFTKVMLKTELTGKQKEYLTAVKMSGDSLIVLINDILDLAKVDAGKMTFENTPFKLALSINAMLHNFK
jgi:two-component system, chemotaxis family, CheB/CheR fusion protein